jgi:hypothetical protein
MPIYRVNVTDAFNIAVVKFTEIANDYAKNIGRINCRLVLPSKNLFCEYKSSDEVPYPHLLEADLMTVILFMIVDKSLIKELKSLNQLKDEVSFTGALYRAGCVVTSQHSDLVRNSPEGKELLDLLKLRLQVTILGKEIDQNNFFKDDKKDAGKKTEELLDQPRPKNP